MVKVYFPSAKNIFKLFMNLNISGPNIIRNNLFSIMSHSSITLPVSFLDFPYVCRVCLGREDLESFEEENMMELFFKITNIVVDSNPNLPRKICKECLNALIDISVFIDISKLNDATLKKTLMTSEGTENKTNECKEAVPHHFPSTCRSCLGKTDLNLVEENPYLCSLFQQITDIEINCDIYLINNICSKCLEKLEQISAFINLSRRNDASLHQVFINKNLKYENTQNCSEGNDYEKMCSDDTEVENTVPFEEIKSDNASLHQIFTNKIVKRENTEHYSEMKEYERMFSDNTEVESTVPFEKIKLECLAEEKQLFTFEEFKVPTDKLKLETSVKEESVSNGDQMKIELDSENYLPNIETGIFTCDDCNKDFPEVPSKIDYVGEYPAQCNRCGKRVIKIQEFCYEAAQALKQKKTHSSKKRKPPIQCEICFKTLRLYSSLRNHMKMHSGERPFECETCHKTFYRKSDLAFHMNSHSTEKPFQCGLCGKCFTNKTYLRIHLGIHATEKPFRCEICSKLVSSGAGLRYHMKTHIESKPLFTCEICLKSFSVKGTLNMHMRFHSGEKLAQCEVCSKIFAQKSDLKTHMRMHTGEKPFQCEVCSKTFKFKGNLNVHMRTHADEKPFKCEVCFKGFCQKSWLRSHMRVHTGEKPFPCEVCGKCYAQKPYLRSHMRVHAPKILTNDVVVKEEAVETERDIHFGEVFIDV